jgi:photosystem II PsbZ protein
MVTSLQVAVLLLILLSFRLVIGVPVVFAYPAKWSQNKGIVIGSGAIWLALVCFVGILNYFII